MRGYHASRTLKFGQFPSDLSAHTFAASVRHQGRYIESDFLVKAKRRVGRKSEALISAVGALRSLTIETHRRRRYALLGLPETQNNRPRPTGFPGRKRRHYSVPTPLYHEIGLLKNYAESRGPIPRNHSVETLLSGQVL